MKESLRCLLQSAKHSNLANPPRYTNLAVLYGFKVRDRVTVTVRVNESFFAAPMTLKYDYERLLCCRFIVCCVPERVWVHLSIHPYQSGVYNYDNITTTMLYHRICGIVYYI